TAKQIIPTNQLYPIHNDPPWAFLDAPLNGQHFAAPATLTLLAEAGDNDGTIARVDFHNGATLLGSVSNAPYALTLPALPARAYVLSALPVDNHNGQLAPGASTNTGDSATPAPYGITPRVAASPFLNPPPGSSGTIPPKLSQTGVFSDAASLTPVNSLIPYG